MKHKKRIVILASGSGSNMQSIIDYTKSNDAGFEVIGLIVNNPNAYAIERAKNENIKYFIINHRDFKNRNDFENSINSKLNELNCEIVVCAGFMRILQAQFVEKWEGKIINIHPSLLPKYKGLNTHQRAIDDKEEFAGCSVHFVNPGVDEGAIIGQASVKIDEGETAQSLANKVLLKEHILFPKCVDAVANKEIMLLNGNAIFKNNQIIVV